MGFLLKPRIFSFHSSGTAPRRLLNRLVLLTLFIVALQIKDAKAVVDQTEQEIDLQASSCETKTLDDVPPDPVSGWPGKSELRKTFHSLPFLSSHSSTTPLMSLSRQHVNWANLLAMPAKATRTQSLLRHELMSSESTPKTWPTRHSRRTKICSLLHSLRPRCLWLLFNSVTKSTTATSLITPSWASTGASWASHGTNRTAHTSGGRPSKTVDRCRADGFGLLVLPLLFSMLSELEMFFYSNLGSGAIGKCRVWVHESDVIGMERPHKRNSLLLETLEESRELVEIELHVHFEELQKFPRAFTPLEASNRKLTASTFLLSTAAQTSSKRMKASSTFHLSSCWSIFVSLNLALILCLLCAC